MDGISSSRKESMGFKPDKTAQHFPAHHLLRLPLPENDWPEKSVNGHQF